MRIFALILLMSFSFQTVDVPPPSAAKNPKTCCARAICLCKHAKGAPCDYKRKVPPPPFSSPAGRNPMVSTRSQDLDDPVFAERGRIGGGAPDGDCPFHKGMKKREMKASSTDKVVAVRVKTLKNEEAGFTQAPCHTNTPKSLLPNTIRDYEPSLSFEMSKAQPFQVWFQNGSKFYLSPGLSGPDHPPRVLFSF